MTKKDILIVTKYFYPFNTPRAHRAFELAREMSRVGCNVTVLTAAYSDNYEELENKEGIKILVYKSYIRKNDIKIEDSASTISIPKRFVNTFKRVMFTLSNYFLPEGRESVFAFKLYLYLRRFEGQYDLIISNAFPFAVHLGLCSKIKKLKKEGAVSVAETSDPFYFGHTKKAFYLKILEKKVLDKFDFISVPIEGASNLLKKEYGFNNVKVIPQGYLLPEKVDVISETKNQCVTFCYAGRLYGDIRNPLNYIKLLSLLKVDFKFVMLLDMKSRETRELSYQYKKILGSKLVLKDFMPRKQCIDYLRQFDFLINFSNTSSDKQLPSKLIDYAISNRPILSLSTVNNENGKIENFLNGNYSEATFVDLNSHNIKNVAQRFLEL